MQNISLSREAFAAKITQLSAAWKALPPEEREAFEVMARTQQAGLDDLSARPLPTAGQAALELVANELPPAASMGSHDMPEQEPKQVSAWRNAAKKISSRRLARNREAYESHPVWLDKITQLGDANGALKAALIDLVSADGDIDSFLEKSLHKCLTTTDTADALAGDVKQCLPYLCKDSPTYSLVQRWQRVLHQHLQKASIKPGALLTFKARTKADLSITHYLLGVALQRPLLLTLLEVTLSSSEVRPLLEDGVPAVCTASEMFLALLKDRRDQDAPPGVQVDVRPCRASLEPKGGLRVTCRDQFYSFDLNQAPEPNPKPKMQATKLPFGLRPLKRQKRKKEDEVADIDDIDMNLEEDETADIDINLESESMAPAFDVVCENTALQEVEAEQQKADELRQEVAEAHRAQQHPSSGSTFFSKDLGVADAGFAATGRAICLSCKRPIAKGSIRFAFNHNRSRPHGWLHSDCVSRHVLETNTQQESVRRLLQLSGLGDKAIRDKVGELLAVIRREQGQRIRRDAASQLRSSRVVYALGVYISKLTLESVAIDC